MSAFRRSLAFAALLLTAAAPARAQLLGLKTVCTPVGCMDPANQPVIRRVVQNGVTFKGNLMDFVSRQEIIVSDPSITLNTIRGYPCEGMGCLETTITVPQSFDVDAHRTFTITFNHFGTVSVRMFVVRAGVMRTLAQSPNPGHWGSPDTVTVTGTDVGHARVQPTYGTATVIANDDSRFVFVATTTAAPSSTATALPFHVFESNVTNMPQWNYIGAGQAAVAYTAVVGAQCVASTTVVPPAPISPANGAVIAYASDPEKALVTLTWTGALTSAGNGTDQPNTAYQYEVAPALSTVTLSGDLKSGTPLSSPTSTTTTTTMPTLSATTAAGVKQASVTLSRNRSYKWRVRSIQCPNTSSPTVGPYSAYATFATK